VRTQQQ